MTYKRNYERLSPRVLARLLACYDSASIDERTSGLQWYAKAHAYATDLARSYSYTVPQVCGVIAALSPGLDWTRNLEDAETAVNFSSPR